MGTAKYIVAGLVIVILAACASNNPYRRTDHIPPDLAVRFCSDTQAAFNIGRYLAERDLPIVRPERIAECPEKQRGVSADAYRAGIKRVQMEAKCNPQAGQVQGRKDALAQNARNSVAYCSDKQLGLVYATAYDNGYRTGTVALCDGAVSNAQNQGNAEGLAGGRQYGVAQKTLRLCDNNRHDEIQTAYATGVKQGQFQACENEVTAAAAQGQRDGLKGIRSQPQLKRCPRQRNADLLVAYSKGFTDGELSACENEITQAEKQGKSDGFDNRKPALPTMQRCLEPDRRQFNIAYSRGVAIGKRNACQNEMDQSKVQGRRDAVAGKTAYSLPMIHCPQEVGPAFLQAYSDGYNNALEQAQIAACPSELVAHQYGVEDALANVASSVIGVHADCTGRYREQANNAYRAGVAEGHRRQQANIAAQERRDQKSIAKSQLNIQAEGLRQQVYQREHEVDQQQRQNIANKTITQVTANAQVKSSLIGAGGQVDSAIITADGMVRSAEIGAAGQLRAVEVADELSRKEDALLGGGKETKASNNGDRQTLGMRAAVNQYRFITGKPTGELVLPFNSIPMIDKFKFSGTDQRVFHKFHPTVVAYTERGKTYIRIQTDKSDIDVSQGVKDSDTERGYYIESINVSISNSSGFRLDTYYPETPMGSSMVSNSQGWNASVSASISVTAGAMPGATGTVGVSGGISGNSSSSSQVQDFTITPQLTGNNDGVGWNAMLCNAVGATGDSGDACVYKEPEDLKQVDLEGYAKGGDLRELPKMAISLYSAINYVALFVIDDEYTGLVNFDVAIKVNYKKVATQTMAQIAPYLNDVYKSLSSDLPINFNSTSRTKKYKYQITADLSNLKKVQ